MKRIILCILIIAVFFTGCSVCELQPPSEETPTPTPEPLENETQDLMQNVIGKSYMVKKPDDDAIEHMENFSIALFQRNYEKEKNTLISPLSVLIALAMTANGADGETLKQMEQVLGEGFSIHQTNMYCSYLLNEFCKDGQVKMNCANSIWFRDTATFTPRQDFLQTNADYYGASVYKAAFDDRTLQDINQWVTEKTNGMIENILDEIPANAMLYIINALAFEGKWKDAYSENSIRDGVFTNHEGKKQSVELMYSTEEQYLEDGSATGFIKEYAGGQYSFVALLPKEGVSLDDYVTSLTGDGFQTLLATAKSTDISVAIPKFCYDYDVLLNQSLMEMGITDAFSPQLADFSKMAEVSDGNLYISRVIHKTFIAVDEEGTRAGAATIVEVPKCSAPTETYTVHLTRPFVYAIVDNTTGIPAFMGAVVDLG